MMSALLSHALVACTIEIDNEFEHRVPHSTTRSGFRPGAPWLTSFAMWENCLRFIDERGVSITNLTRRAGTTTNLNGMQRWGYILISPNRLITLTPGGKRAQKVWEPLPAEIEQRWRERFGGAVIDDLRRALAAIAGRHPMRLPDCLPILRYGLTTPRPTELDREHRNLADLPLPALMSKVLLWFALEFERESPVSIAIAANVLRLVGDDTVRVRDLPHLSGVSKEGIAMAVSFLNKHGYAIVSPGIRTITLTPKGRDARDLYHRFVQRWEDDAPELRLALDALPAERLWQGIEPYPDGWRASLPTRDALPDFPMVLHRGGYPDGS